MAPVLSLHVFKENVITDDTAVGTVRRHPTDLHLPPGSATQFLSLNFPSCKVDTNLSSTAPLPGLSWGTIGTLVT